MSQEALPKARPSVSSHFSSDLSETDIFHPAAYATTRHQRHFERELSRRASIHSEEWDDPQTLRRYPLPIILSTLYQLHDDLKERQLPAIAGEVRHLLDQFPQDAEFRLLPGYIDYLRAQIHYHIQEQEQRLFPYISYLQDACRYGTYYAQRVHNGVKDILLKTRPDDEPGNLAESTDLLLANLIARQPGLADELSFQLLAFRLGELFRDYDFHLRVEQDILIPKAKAMQVALARRATARGKA